jgi:hypothetical protein
MFFSPGHVFGGNEGVLSWFHILLSRTCFRRSRGRQVPFSCFALPDTFSTVRRASGPVLMFCAPELIFDGIEDVGYRFNVLHSRTRFQRYRGVWFRFHVLRARTHFRRYRGRRVPFSCFARHDMFSAIPRASGPVFMFCAFGLVFDGTEVVRSCFHVLRSLTCFRR